MIRAVDGAKPSHLRGFKWAFRLGDDELAILLPHGRDEVGAMAVRLRSVVAEIRIRGVLVTGSFGVAAF